MSERRPPPKLTVDDLIDLNRRVLEFTAFEGDRPHGVQNPAGLRRALGALQRLPQRDPYRRAALLCCAIIANHPFNDGNHRTSMEAATLQLLLEGWIFTGSVEDERRIYNWRFDYEEAHDLEAEWARIFGGWDSHAEDGHLTKLLNGEYGREIERFLRLSSQEFHLDAFLVALPPDQYALTMRAFPASPWKKEVRRARRARASRLRKIVWPEFSQAINAAAKRRPARPKAHWRPEKF